jgi:transient receptor potential cation channel subfamily M protein 2
MLNERDKADKKQPLDPNHTHFILVDTAQVKYGGEIKFRGELESAIANKNQKNTTSIEHATERIPIVVLVLEGGVGTIQTVLESVKNGTPCVFIEVNHFSCWPVFKIKINFL